MIHIAVKSISFEFENYSLSTLVISAAMNCMSWSMNVGLRQTWTLHFSAASLWVFLFIFNFIFVYLFFGCVACRILVSQPEPEPSAMETWILFFLFLIYFLFGGKLLYNVVLVSALWQCKSAFLPSLHPTLLGHHRAPSWAPYVI